MLSVAPSARRKTRALSQEMLSALARPKKGNLSNKANGMHCESDEITVFARMALPFMTTLQAGAFHHAAALSKPYE